MAGLLDLKQQVDSSAAAPETAAQAAPPVAPQEQSVSAQPQPVAANPPPAPSKPQPVRGDDLMASAQGYLKLTDSETAGVNLFKQSYDLVNAKMKQDPEYANKLAPELGALKGAKYIERIGDEADNIKIESLKQSHPELFQNHAALTLNFLNGVTFNQLSRITGKIGELVQGRPYEEVVKEQAELIRLISKESKDESLIGKAAAFLIPGSPVAKLFTGAAGQTLKYAEPVIEKLSKNSELLNKVLRATVYGGAGGAAVAGVEGALGTDQQDFSFDRGAEHALQGALFGGALSAAPVVAVEGVSKAAEVAAPILRSGAKSLGELAASVGKQLSGADPKAIRAYNRNSEAIKQAAGSEAEVGAELVDYLLNTKASRLPELQQADALLKVLPDTSPKRVVDYLRGIKKTSDPKLDAAVDALGLWADRIEAKLAGREKLPATEMRALVDDFQQAAKDQFGKESNLYITALKRAARLARTELVGVAAQEGGEIGKTYVELMQKGASKTRILDYVGKQLGKSEQQQAQNAERFIKNMFGTNKTIVQQRMAQLDAQFGTSFLEKARNANFAKQLGPEGAPQLFPQQTTGRSSLGVKLFTAAGAGAGSLIGGAPGAVVGASAGAATGSAVSSPKAAAALIGASDKISGFLHKMTADPEALARLAGMAAKRGGPGAEKAVAQLRVPIEVRKLASQVYQSLQKDGPLSAGSTVRVIADTPYFLGLVHYFDVIQRQSQSKETVNALGQQQTNIQGR